MTEAVDWKKTHFVPNNPEHEEMLVAAPYITAYADHPGKAILALYLATNPDVNEQGMKPAQMARTIVDLGHLSKQIPAYANTIDWCNGPFYTSGALEKVGKSTGSTKDQAFRLSKGGLVGAGIAAATVLFSEESGVKMPFMGRSRFREGKINSHHIRIQIMRYLVSTTEGQHTFAGFNAAMGGITGPSTRVEDALLDMHGSKMLQYTPNDRKDATYASNQDEIHRSFRRNTTPITRDIVTYIKTTATFSHSEVVQNLLLLPRWQETDEKWLRQRVAQSLMMLVETGRISRRTYRHLDGKVQCTMSNFQRQNMAFLVESMKDFEMKIASDTGFVMESAKKLLTTPGRVRRVLANNGAVAARDSLGRQQTATQAVHTVLQKTEQSSVTEIALALSEDGTPYSPTQIRLALGALIKSGRATSVEGHGTTYFTRVKR